MKGFVPQPPIARHGVIGDRRTAALVAGDGTIGWLCLRDYDDDPVFASLIDARRGGWWRMGPRLPRFGRQRYIEDTAVLVTTWSDGAGALELTDAMPWPDEERSAGDEPRRVVLRRLRCTGGEADCCIELHPRDLDVADVMVEPAPGGLGVRMLGRRDLGSLGVWSTRPLRVDRAGTGASAHFTLRAGESAWVVLSVDEPASAWSERAAAAALEATARSWRAWMQQFDLGRDHAAAARRSLLTIHLLGYAPSGAMVAAPTLGLPERVGGPRNYDYRYAWIRDASLSVSALSLAGDSDTAARYLRWLSGLGSRTRAPLQVAYDVHGGTKLSQRRWRGPAGYRQSKPVLVGNRAYDQRQIGSLGYVADCIQVAVEGGAEWRAEYAALLARMARYVCDAWHEPDSGIWELRKRQQFVASKVMCWVVLDRAVRLVGRFGRVDAGELGAWRDAARAIRESVLDRGYDERLGAFRQRYGHASVDAASLLVPITGLLPPDDPRVRSTLDVIDETLGFESFVYRFVPSTSEGEEVLPVGQFEGAFLPCTLWMATARAMAGQVQRAEAILEGVERAAGELGLLAEEIDPRTGDWLGNYPLLFSHVELLRAIVAVEHAKAAPQLRASSLPCRIVRPDASGGGGPVA